MPGDQSRRQAEQEKEYNFKLSDIVPENRRRVEQLMKVDPRTPEEEQEFITLVGNTNQLVKQNKASQEK